MLPRGPLLGWQIERPVLMESCTGWEGIISTEDREAVAMLRTSVGSYKRDSGAEGRLCLLQPLAAVPAGSAAGAQGTCNRTSDVPAARLVSPAFLVRAATASCGIIRPMPRFAICACHALRGA